MLDNEASEDEAARKHAKLDRTPSHEANVELVEKEKRYRAIIAQAATSDGSVREKWEEWESNIRELTWSEVRRFFEACWLKATNFSRRKIWKQPSHRPPFLRQHR